MNLFAKNSEEERNVLYMSLNKNQRGVNIGTVDGYRIVSFPDDRGIVNVRSGLSGEAIHIVEQFYLSNLIYIVKTKTPRTIYMLDHSRGIEACNMAYHTAILAIRFNRLRLCIITEKEIFIYDAETLKLIATIKDSIPNPEVCAISDVSEKNLFIFPCHPRNGEIVVYEITKPTQLTAILAHRTPVQSLRLNDAASLLATASVKGTIIRIFSLPQGNIMYELRRGLVRNVEITWMAFSMDSRLLCTTSLTNTVHVFELDGQSPDVPAPEEEEKSWTSTFTSILKLPYRLYAGEIEGTLGYPKRNLFSFPINYSNLYTLCSILKISTSQYLICVVNEQGELSVHKFDPETLVCEVQNQTSLLIPTEGTRFHRL